jgi:hypothetical protein
VAASVLYAVACFNFYMLSFYLKYFPGNIFENSAIYACSDLLAMILVGVAFRVTSMQNGMRFACAMAFTGGMLYLFLSARTDLIPYMICFARVGQTMQFNITIVSVNRLFPTQYVTTAYGICNFMAHSFACLSPFMAEILNPYPFIVFNSLLVFAVLASFKITEVKQIITKTEQEGPPIDTALNE